MFVWFLSGIISNRYESAINELSLTAVETVAASSPAASKSNTTKSKNNKFNSKSQKRTLIMVLWVSVMFSSSRLVSAIANLVLLFLEDSIYNWWTTAFSFFYLCCVYASYFFVYMRTNKLFRRRFYRIFMSKKLINSFTTSVKENTKW